MTNSTQDPFSTVLAAAPTIGVQLTRPGRDEEETEACELMVQSVRSWASRTLDDRAIDEAHDVAPEVYQSAAELGLFGLTIPETFGGAGFSLSAAARVIEEAATFDRSVATSVGLHCGLGLRGLIRFGSPALQERFLPALATGEKIAAFAATEPDAGSHIAGVKTVAAWDGDSQLTVNGSKCFVTNGGIADVFTILAKTPGLGGARRGYSLLMLPRDLEGLEVGAEENKMGIRGSSTTTLSFDDVEIDTGLVIGEPSKGLDLMSEILAWGRTLMSAGCLGTAREAYRRAAAYVLERHQFGKPIGSFGLVREKIANMRARLYATESLVRLTTLLQSAHGSDIVWESSVAKVFASEAVWSVTDDALQLHGGMGFIEETGLSRLLRDCRITRIFEGANEVLRFHIAAGALGLADPLTALPRLAPQLDPRLEEMANQFSDRATRVGVAFRSLRDRFGIRVTEHQFLLGAAADSAAGAFVLLAVALRAHGDLGLAGNDEQRAEILDLARQAAELIARDVDQGLAATERTDEESRIKRLSEREYERVQARS